MNVTTVPRFALKTSLRLARVPLDLVGWAVSTMAGGRDSGTPYEEALAHEAASERAGERLAQQQRMAAAKQQQAAKAQERAERERKA